MDLQQVKSDVDNEVLVAPATWRKVLDTALTQEAEVARLAAERAELERLRASHDMAIGEAVQRAAFEAVREGSYEFWPVRLNKLNLAAIIAKVKP